MRQTIQIYTVQTRNKFPRFSISSSKWGRSALHTTNNTQKDESSMEEGGGVSHIFIYDVALRNPRRLDPA